MMNISFIINFIEFIKIHGYLKPAMLQMCFFKILCSCGNKAERTRNLKQRKPVSFSHQVGYLLVIGNSFGDPLAHTDHTAGARSPS